MPAAVEAVRNFEARGAVAQVFKSRAEEILIHGPAGTGKSRGILEKLHLAMLKYPGARGLLVRKTRSSLTNTGMVTFEKEVLVPGDKILGLHTPTQSYKYPNGSSVTVGGMDDSAKIMSSQYDIAIYLEATEASVDDWEAITTRLRNGVMPYQQLIADCNPGSPSHWLWRRKLAGGLVAFASKHEDNPALYEINPKTKKGKWTDRGKAYLKKLQNLTGVRRKRLYEGIWCSAEGAVYDTFDPTVHVISGAFEIPESWPRYWGIDFGYTNPFVWGAFALDPDGRLYLYREIYRTKRTIETHCQQIRGLKEPKPSAVICDWDGEDRATCEAALDIKTLPAKKEVSTGIQAVTDRLKIQPDGKPRLYILANALIEPDPELEENELPRSTIDEFDSYVWDDTAKNIKEVPVKKYDHGLDRLRYVVMHLDGKKLSRPRITALN